MKFTLKILSNLFYVSGIEIKIHNKDETYWCVTATTPIMRRAQRCRESKEIIFVDSTSSCDSESTTVTIALTGSKGGGIPIAVMLHNRQDEIAYTFAFQCVKDTYPTCFGGETVCSIYINTINHKTAKNNNKKNLQTLKCYQFSRLQKYL